ncbi:MAG: acyl-ACP--UDP-N-acetylglucosamine O-acyltransferase [Phycisphaeraceae bacterium]|nr:acyl-ACP--UDP-N-acetylglucosamine O-acyltransferase [Phycisphaerales bacterium]MCB9860755.1 acyl-ACP--UDP-N-acetylglucosamine O-acyltransferase [Phycisphaeraceae bacterium]
MPNVHPTAIVDPACTLADDVSVGPFSILQGPIRIGAGTTVLERVSMRGPATIGEHCTIYPGCTLGFPPQDFKFTPESVSAGVQIGNHTVLRENATVHAATNPDTPTHIGDRVFMMVNAHVGHDSRIDNNAILTNNTMIAGHVHIAEKAILSGGVAVHQFCRVGRMAMVSGGSVTVADVPPFCIAWGRSTISGLNLVGLRRSGFDREHISMLRKAYSDTFREHLSMGEIIDILSTRSANCPPLDEWIQFLKTSKRTIATHMNPADVERAARIHATEAYDE